MNRLAAETSPYLRQHRDNPVDWYPWGPEAFAAARAANRPILLSVGYSACHWCHVMAHECFEDAEVAERMNALFVNVKVDREERPDVDALYMDAVQAMTNRGGWPMTVFLTPEGNPFFGGTYFPKDQFLQLLNAVDDAWRNKRTDLQQNVNALLDAIKRTVTLQPTTTVPGLPLVNGALQALVSTFDGEHGGFGTAPKFPSTAHLELLLKIGVVGDSNGARQIVGVTLDAMSAGGIYDHLGGGFARYSVDNEWLVPHFEKMLYDQALLARIFLRGAVAVRLGRWRQVAEETIEYVLRELLQPEGGFSSAEDADSVDTDGTSREGAFYLWTPEQITEVLGPRLGAIALDWYGVTAEGNFEGRSILSRRANRGSLQRPELVEQARAALFEARSKRPRPGLDDKVLTEWNGLMLATLAEAGAALARPDWLDTARRNAEFLLDNLRDERRHWYRSWHRDGGPRHRALAADLAAMVEGFTRLAEATGEARWIYEAMDVADELLDQHWDPSSGGLYTTADDGDQLIVRQKDLIDNATPSANSVAAYAFYRLAALTGEQRYANQADQILQLIAALVPNAPTAFSNALLAVDLHHWGVTEIAVVGDRADLSTAVQQRYLPNAVLAWGEPYESPLWENRPEGRAYVCKHYACQEPQDTLEGLLTQLYPPKPEPVVEPASAPAPVVPAEPNAAPDAEPATPSDPAG